MSGAESRPSFPNFSNDRLAPLLNTPGSRIRGIGKLLSWYGANCRHLPWRATADPYAIWLSEIMLQQTQVDTVLPYYLRFLEKFPTVNALAEAPLVDILKSWENLGYYSRARHLHKAAGLVVAKHAGKIPDRWEELILMPGIGRYTAGAILSIAFGQALPAVDGNVRRVISRLFVVEDSIDDPATREKIEEIVRPLIPKRNPGLFNQALMELGALTCKPKTPNCPACPLRNFCRARKLGRVGNLPVRGKRRPVPHKEGVAAVVHDGAGRLLIVRRPPDGLLGSLWKFPGGILTPGETGAEGLRRTVREELGMDIGVGPQIIAVKHAYTHFRITLTAFACTLPHPNPSPTGHTWRWSTAEEVNALPFSKVDRVIARTVTPA